MTVAAQTKAIIENYLNEMGAPRKYFDMMYAIPKGDIRWISEDELESDFRGFIPELRDWIDARCDKLTKGEKALWEILGRQHDAASPEVVMDIIKKLGEQHLCENEEHGRLAAGAWLKIHDTNNSKPNRPLE